MNRTRTAALAFAVLALAGCGGSAASSSTAAAPPAASVIADQLGATDVQAMDPTLYAYDEVTATWHGKTVDIATFRTNGLRDKWVAAAGRFTGIDSKGDRYAVADG
jgi:ABC-type phosphate transport system substrate-binding protein